MTFSLPRRTYALWLLRLSFVIVFACVFIVDFCKNYSKILLPTAIVMIGSVFVCVYLFVYFKSYKISLDEDSFVLKKGIIIKSTIIIPCVRIALVKVFATPLMVVFGVKSFALKTSRGWTFLPEIDKKQLECLLGKIYYDKNDL